MCKLKKGEKIVKARKDHKCDKCNGILHKSRKYKLYKEKVPIFDNNMNQTGVEYITERYHLNDNCDGILPYVSDVKKYFKGCCKGKHESFPCHDEYGDFEGYFCAICGIELDIDGEAKQVKP